MSLGDSTPFPACPSTLSPATGLWRGRWPICTGILTYTSLSFHAHALHAYLTLCLSCFDCAQARVSVFMVGIALVFNALHSNWTFCDRHLNVFR